MGVDEIITLDNGNEFKLIKEVMVEDDRYFIATPDVEAEIPINFTVLIQSFEDGEEYVEEVDDKDFIDKFIEENLN
ncbi:MAG: hypothetical protein IJO63_01020 [Bacilli bacterium]|nr:hypothetical protein [Bacilli bacterium]